MIIVRDIKRKSLINEKKKFILYKYSRDKTLEK
ncbi:hypothetical protein AX25_00075 [Listeria ivanovii WSLC3009]|nr:hypothetical protein AX25_00075 [Listeria ivanovii WSLC3009]